MGEAFGGVSECAGVHMTLLELKTDAWDLSCPGRLFIPNRSARTRACTPSTRAKGGNRTTKPVSGLFTFTCEIGIQKDQNIWKNGSASSTWVKLRGSQRCLHIWGLELQMCTALFKWAINCRGKSGLWLGRSGRLTFPCRAPQISPGHKFHRVTVSTQRDAATANFQMMWRVGVFAEIVSPPSKKKKKL